MINFLIKNNLSKFSSLNSNLKRNEKTEAVIECYMKMLKFLKEHNAMVNSIRPHFLISFVDWKNLYKSNLNPNVNPNYYKPKESKFTILQLTNWILLFNQIVKIFYFSRINAKNLKTIFVGCDFKPTPPFFEYTPEKNTIYSVPELVLLKWFEILKFQSTGNQHKFCNFETDFNDSVAIASAIESYILLDLKILSKMKLKG